MARNILVYGHGDKSEKGFLTPEAFEQYLGGGVFREESGRYRYTQNKRADIIVLSRDGLAFGHFEVDSMETPNEEDRKAYPPVKQVYLICKSVRYERKVRMSTVGISRYQFGKYISEQKFNEIVTLAGATEEFRH